MTSGSAQNMSWVPLPWWASQSTMRTLAPRARSSAAATATLLIRQNPIACVGSAWCPGGRTAQNAAVPAPCSRPSIAANPEPAARSAASQDAADAAVSGSRAPPPRAQNASS